MLLETTNIVNVAKCDFCTKDAVGYTNYQICLYCADHQQMAEDRTREILDSMERDRQHMAEILTMEQYISGKIVDEIELDDPNPTKETVDRMARLCDRLRKIKGMKEEMKNG